MATLWLSSSASKTIEVGDSVSITAYCDPTGLSSGISSYRARIMIGGGVAGSTYSWTKQNDGSWKVTVKYTFSSEGTYNVGVALTNTSGSNLGITSGTIKVYVEESSTTTYYARVKLNGMGAVSISGTETYSYPVQSAEDTSDKGYANVMCFFDGDSVFPNQTDHKLLGFAKTSSAASLGNVFYPVADSISIKATSTSKSSPTTTTLYAVWEQKEKTYYGRVILDGNGGTYKSGSSNLSTCNFDGESDPTTMAYGLVSIPYSDPGFTRSGYSILGFSEDSDSEEAEYGRNGTYTMVANSASESSPTKIRLYAVWGTGRPENWSWTTKNISAGSAMNTNADGDPTPLTAKEWLNFITRIEDFAEYCGVALNSTYLSNARTGVSTGKSMTRTQANGARNLIYQMNAYVSSSYPVPSTVPSGGKITASFINGLKNSLNSIYK